MSRITFPNPAGTVPPLLANLDQWDGYAPQRTRLLRHLADAAVANPVVLAGDIHSTWLSELKLDFDRPEQPSVAVEFVATSVSSDSTRCAPVRSAPVRIEPLKVHSEKVECRRSRSVRSTCSYRSAA